MAAADAGARIINQAVLIVAHRHTTTLVAVVVSRASYVGKGVAANDSELVVDIGKSVWGVIKIHSPYVIVTRIGACIVTLRRYWTEQACLAQLHRDVDDLDIEHKRFLDASFSLVAIQLEALHEAVGADAEWVGDVNIPARCWTAVSP